MSDEIVCKFIPETTATIASPNTIITKRPNLSLNFSVATDGSDAACFQ